MVGYGHGGTGAGCRGSKRARLMIEGTLQWERHWTKARTTRTAGETEHTLGSGDTEARQQRVRQGARRCRWWPALVTVAVAQGTGARAQ